MLGRTDSAVCRFCFHGTYTKPNHCHTAYSQRLFYRLMARGRRPLAQHLQHYKTVSIFIRQLAATASWKSLPGMGVQHYGGDHPPSQHNSTSGLWQINATLYITAKYICHASLHTLHACPHPSPLFPAPTLPPAPFPSRYVENELLGMKSLFDSKEACLRQELSEERDRLAREAGVLKQQVEEATAARAAAGVRPPHPRSYSHVLLILLVVKALELQ